MNNLIMNTAHIFSDDIIISQTFKYKQTQVLPGLITTCKHWKLDLICKLHCF